MNIQQSTNSMGNDSTKDDIKHLSTNGQKENLSGLWSKNVHWSFKEGTTPSEELVTAVFCLVLSSEGVVLVKTHRGYWEMVGGHREQGESVTQALLRETKEEGAVELKVFHQFGYREVRNDAQITNKTTGKPYPPIGYIPFFVGTGEIDAVQSLAEDVVSRRAVSLDHLATLNATTFPDIEIFRIGLRSLIALLPEGCRERETIGRYFVNL